MEEKKKEADAPSGFKVSDKRHFTSDGERIDEGIEPEERKTPAAGTESRAPAEEKPPPPTPEEEGPVPPGISEEKKGEGLPPADFIQIVEFLFQNAAFALGLIPDPSSGQQRIDLPHASHFIDLLGVLHEKTKGNLSSEEEALLQDMLTRLRTLFAGISKRER